ERAVEIAVVLQGRSVEVDLELVPGDGHRGPDLELAAVEGLERVDRLEAPVGEACDRGTHAALGVGVQLVHRGLDACATAPLAQLFDSPRGEAVRGELGAEVTAALLRVAHPR